MEELLREHMDVKVLTEMITLYGSRILLAILTILVGLRLIGFFVNFVAKRIEASSIDNTLKPYIVGVLSTLSKIALFISVATMVGVETTSFVAILGSAGLAIGLALQGSLSNFAGGAILLIFRPFRVGDFIEAQGFGGTVKEIQIFHTVLNTPDNKTIILPNGPLAGEPITNVTLQPIRRVDMVFGIGYQDDIAKAKNILHNIFSSDKRVHKDPEPFIVVSSLGDSAVNITTRVWCNTSDYWDVFFEAQEKAKLTFDAQGISIPFPQRDVHLYEEKNVR